MNEGKTHNYYWIEGTDFTLHDLVTNCPELFVGRTVAITAFDSGPLLPNEEEIGFGWYSKDGVFYAPEITDPQKLPYEQYDEWYVFNDLKEFKPIDLFVNYGSFFLRDPGCQLDEVDPTWDKVGLQNLITDQKEFQEQFWNFVCQIQPQFFVMDGDCFIFGSCFAEDVELIKSIMAGSK